MGAMSATEHLSPDQWSFDVIHATHDEVKAGRHDARRSRVNISRAEYPDSTDASSLAAQMTMAVHGTMATKVLARY